MKFCIKRGAKEIGGSAVELESQGKRIILDLGLPLDAETSSPDLLPDIKGLKEKTDDLLALLISHPHQDHYALGEFIDKNIPIYMGKIASEILKAAKSIHL
ncbi:MAG: putative ribonuclease J [Alphaproteobacteria bacterium ADurb.Bin438]|nr:MAG: putative ribonuclease J [Alphaproteobacteria bacterium ADurb.Bin438]